MRPVINIPNTPTKPFPIVVKNTHVIAGFGRGSTEMGIPTANVPIDSTTPEIGKLDTGVYFGFVRLFKPSPDDDRPNKIVPRVDNKSKVEFTYGRGLSDSDIQVLPMVMSLGWNPYFKNKQKACELHIIHDFKVSFYGARLNFTVLGYIRPELNYTTLDSLIKDIHIDRDTAKDYLGKESYEKCKDLI